MADAIGAISSNSVSNVQSGSSTNTLTEETKKKLEALGIDTSKITTETQGQTKLKEAQAAQAAAQTRGQQPPQGPSSMQTIQEEVKALAGKVGVAVGTNDKIEDIFNNISEKISSLQSSAGTDTIKKQEAQGFQAEYTQVYSEYISAKNAQSMLSNSLNALASYNKIALGLN